jgi:hypothetical protein
MNLDDTKDRVFIHDLDEEIASLTPEEEKLIFLPDIDKELTRVPRSVLLGNEPEENNQLVLYKVPDSLSIPEEQDGVRKAMLESRERAREKHLQYHTHIQPRQPDLSNGSLFGLDRYQDLGNGTQFQQVDDADAMELE